MTTRAMFGGHGLWIEERFFGVITGGNVYFRTDDESRSAYIARGSEPLEPPPHRPRGPGTVDRNFRVPAEIIADSARLIEWALRAAKAY